MSISIRNVAEHAGVSIGTVSNVINGLSTVNPKLKRRVNEGRKPEKKDQA